MKLLELCKMRIVLYFLFTNFIIEHNRIYASSIIRLQIDSYYLVMLVLATLPIESDTPALAPTLGAAATAVKKMGEMRNTHHHNIPLLLRKEQFNYG